MVVIISHFVGRSPYVMHPLNPALSYLALKVTVLEKLLGDKTRSSQRHVEELMSLRTQLAQEKASLAIVKQEARDEVERKLGVAKTTQARQAGEFELHLCKMEEGKRRSEKQVDGLKHQLLGEVGMRGWG